MRCGRVQWPAKAKSAIVSPTITDARVLACPTSKRAENSMNDITHRQTRFNNQNNWRDNIQPKQGYYNQYEHTLNCKRPISSIQAGQASSNQDRNRY